MANCCQFFTFCCTCKNVQQKLPLFATTMQSAKLTTLNAQCLNEFLPTKLPQNLVKNTHPCVENSTKQTSTHHCSPNSPPHNAERTSSTITRFGVIHFFCKQMGTKCRHVSNSKTETSFSTKHTSTHHFSLHSPYPWCKKCKVLGNNAS